MSVSGLSACRHVFSRSATFRASFPVWLMAPDIAAAAAAGNRTDTSRLDSTRLMPISWKHEADARHNNRRPDSTVLPCRSVVHLCCLLNAIDAGWLGRRNLATWKMALHCNNCRAKYDVLQSTLLCLTDASDAAAAAAAANAGRKRCSI